MAGGGGRKDPAAGVTLVTPKATAGPELGVEERWNGSGGAGLELVCYG